MYSYTLYLPEDERKRRPAKERSAQLAQDILGLAAAYFFYFPMVSGCFFIFSLATESISLMRLSWLTSLAPGS